MGRGEVGRSSVSKPGSSIHSSRVRGRGGLSILSAKGRGSACGGGDGDRRVSDGVQDIIVRHRMMGGWVRVRIALGFFV